MAGQCIAYVALALLCLASSVDLGMAQAQCFSTEIFGCSGTSAGFRASGQACCDDGFLAFNAAGSDVCEVCSGNVLCSANLGCTAAFEPSQAQGRGECCATGGGVAYTDSAGRCLQCPTSITGCFAGNQCGGDNIPLTSTESAAAQVRECCVSTAGLSYNLLGQCIDCVVFGFLDERLEEEERGQGYTVSIGYIKRPDSVNNLIRGNIAVADGGTADPVTDFQISTERYTVRPGVNQDIIVTYRVDSVAQEPMESAQLELSISTTPPRGLVTRDTFELAIIDSDMVIFQLTENDYRSSESELQINAQVNKNLRIASRVVLEVTPYTVEQALLAGIPALPNVPLNNNTRSPNRALITPERQDFNDSVITVIFEADEFGDQVNDVPVPVPITDDAIDETQEEVFVIDLTLQSSINSQISIGRRSSLARINDDDDLQIGFENISYNFNEPQFEEEISGVVFLRKQNGRITEQSYVVIVGINEATPNANIRAATLSTAVADNDYIVSQPGENTIVLEFGPNDQVLDFPFVLFPDDIAEGTEAFQASSQPSENPLHPSFTAPSADGDDVLFPSTFIVIADDDPIVVGLEQNYTVFENVSTFEVCFRVMNPPDDQEFGLSLDLVPVTNDGSAIGGFGGDFVPLTLDAFRTLDTNNRRACVDVMINLDNIYEGTESFSISLEFDEFVEQEVRDQVTIEPSVVNVEILDLTPLSIGFIDAPYSGAEAGEVVSFQVGVTNDVTLGREVTVDFSTNDLSGLGEGRAAIAGSDYTAIAGQSITFGPSSLTSSVDVVIGEDLIFELTESFGGSLSFSGSLERFTLGPDTALATITDEDVVVFGYNPISYSFGENSGSSDVSVSIASGDPGAFQLLAQYQTQDLVTGGAQAGLDYMAGSGSVQLTSGQQITSHSVTILPDVFSEGTESFGLTLSNPSIQFNGMGLNLQTDEAARLQLGADAATVEILDANVARIGFLDTSYDVNEADGTVEFRVGVIDGNLAAPVTINFATSDGSAIAGIGRGSDYTQTSMSITLTGQEEQVISVRLENDQIYEFAESFSASLSASGVLPSFVTLGPDMAQANIADDDTVIIGFVTDSYNVSETDGPVAMMLSILDGEIAEGVEISVNFFTQDGTAIASGDYTSVVMDFTFSSTTTSQTVSVNIENDEFFENTIESFTGNLQLIGTPERVTIQPAVATVNIEDEDVLVIGFQPDQYSVVEGVDNTVDLVAMVISGSLGRDVSISFTTRDGSAVAGSDYTTTSQTLTFTPTADSRSVTVGIREDSSVELEEQFEGFLFVDTPIDRLTIAPIVANVTIGDTDRASIGFDRAEYDVLENAMFSNVTIRLTGMIDREIVVRVTTQDGSAVSIGPEPDFVSHDMLYTFTPGGPSEIIVPIRILDDRLLENDEDISSIISLSTVTDVIDLSPAEANIRIIDDDRVVIGFTQTVYQATEDVDSSVQLLVNVLMGDLRRDVIVNFATEDGSALDGSDYTGVTQTLTFNEGTVSIPITVDIRRDDINEVLERFIGRLTTDDVDVILSPNVTTVEITDNDAVTVSFQQPIYMFAEGVGTGTVCVEKVGATTQSISVMVTGPFQAETGNRVDRVITFAPDQFLQCIDFGITDDRIALEETEMFSWTLMVQGSPELVTLGENSATDILILDDDVLSLTVTKGDVIPESATTARTCITFSNPIARDVEVERSTQMGVPDNSSTPAPAGIAIPGADFTTISSPLTLTPEDSVTGERCFDIELLPDDIVEEAMECFTVELSLPEADRQSILLSGGTQICCIQDDDFVTIGFDPVPYLVEEDDGTVTLNVRIISGQLARPVEALVTTEEGSATSTTPADFINPGTVTLQFDGLATMQTVVINIENDDIFENPEMFFANLVSFDPAVNISPGRAEITIVEDSENNDSPIIGFVPDVYSVQEDDGSVVFNVQIISGSLERDVSVTFMTQSGTATEEAPADYVGSTQTLTFTPNVLQLTAPVTIINDTIVEDDESFTATLTVANPDDATLLPAVATATISGDEPNDFVTIGLEGDYSVTEGGVQEVCAVLVSGTLERDAIVTLSTADGSAIAPGDYSPLSVMLLFNAGTARACANLITETDEVVEGLETLELRLTTDDSAVILDPDTSNVEIVDINMIVIGIQETEISVTEDTGVVEVCAVVLSGDLERDVPFTLTSADGTAIAPGDYTSLSGGDLVFTSEIREVCVNVSIEVDDVYENDETFTVTVATNDNQASVQPDRTTGTVTIADDDSITIGFVPTLVSASESDGTVQLCARVIDGNTDLERDVVINFNTADGDRATSDNPATAPGDYISLTSQLTFRAGQIEQCVDVTINIDDLTEGAEVFSGIITNDAGNPRVTLSPDEAVVTIVDVNDVVIGYLDQPYSFSEDGGVATVRIGVVNGILRDDLVINIQSEDRPGIANPAFPGTDYQSINLNLTFNAGVTEINVPITLLPDNFVEGNELFNTRLTIVTQGLGAMIENNMPIAPVEILDEDSIRVAFEIPERTELETVGDVEVCAVVVEGILAREAIVTVASRDGSALAGEDYEQFSVDLSFDADTNRACFTVTVTNDTRYELPESFDLVLTSSDDSVIIDEPTSVFNINDDDVVVIGFPQEVYDVTEDIGDAPITVQIISGELADGVSVDIFFSNQNVTAFDGSDYTAVTRTLTFTSTITSIPVPVRIVNDMVYEDLEVFVATLSEASLERITVAPGAAIVNIADEDVITIGFVETGVTVGEGGNAGLQVAVISGMLDAEIQVQVTTRDGSASSVNNADYSSVIQPLTFTTTTDVGDVSVLISEDGISEPLENFFADLSLLTNTDRVTIAPAEATVEIVDNDGVTIEIEVPSITEQEDAGVVEVCAVVSNGTLARQTIVTVSSRDGSAIAGEDYEGFSVQLTFGPDMTRVCFNVNVTDDIRHELTETFDLEVTTDDDQINIPRPLTPFNIEDEDEVVIGWDFTVYNVDEEDEQAIICAVVKRPERGVPTFELPAINIELRDGTGRFDAAMSGSDYMGPAEPSSFVFSGTSPFRQCATVRIVNDQIFEILTEQFQATLVETSSTPRVTIDPSQTRINIRDTDVITIGFVETNVMVSESDRNAGLQVAVLSGMLDFEIGIELEVTTRDGSASSVNDADYTSLTRRVTLMTTTDVGDVSVPISEDTIAELNENFFADLRVIASTAGTVNRVTVVPDEATVTIEDNDVVRIGFEREVYPAFENVTAMICARLLPDSPSLDREVVVTIRSSDGTATAPADYMQIVEQLTFGPGVSRVCVEVLPVDDGLVEGPETFNVTLTSDDDVVLVPDVATVVIQELDMVLVMFERPTYTFTENGITGSVIVVKTGITDQPFSVQVIGGPSTQTDVVISASGFNEVVTFEAGPDADNSITVQFTLTDDDVALEAIESYIGSLDIVGNPEGVILGMIDTTIVNVRDDDVVTVTFGRPELTVDEGVGNFTMCVTLDRETLQPVTVTIEARDGSAISPGDFNAGSIPTSLTIPAGATSACFEGMIVDDTIDEDTESFTLVITGVTPEGVVIGGDTTVISITDNDVVVIGFEQEVYPAFENVTAMICARLLPDSPSLDREVVVTIRSSDGTATAPADYNAIIEQLTFGPGVSRVCVEVLTVDDGLVEGLENFTVTLTSDNDDVVLVPDVATVVIQELDMVFVMFERPTYTFTENGITGSVVVVKTGVTDQPFSVRVTGGPSTQTDVEISASGFDEVVTFEAGSDADNSITVQFTLTDDEVALEAIESYIGSLDIVGNPEGVTLGMIDTTIVNVQDDDVVTVTFGRPELTVDEGVGNFTMCVTLDRETLQPVTVTIEARDGSAVSPGDFNAGSIPTSLTIPAGATSACFEGMIVDDTIVEDTESFTLVITGVTPEGVVIGGDTTVISITDNEDATVRFERTTYSVSEDANTTEVCLIKDLATSDSVTVQVTTTDGTATGGGVDYTGGPFDVTFSSAANDRQCITIGITLDTISETSESFTADIVITPGSGVTEGNPSTATVTITDIGTLVNDSAIGDPLMTVPIRVSQADLNVLGTDQVSLCYEIHGAADEYFNLVTDECISVNSHYAAASSSLNVISQIAVRAMDDVGQCKNILVDIDGCTASVGGAALDATGRYMSNSISVRRYPNRVRISVPNCDELTVVMWVFCESRTMDDPESSTGTVTADMIKFVVMRGLNFGHRDAHGLIGQFWNREVSVTPFTGVDRNGNPVPERYVINLSSPTSGEERTFTGWYYDLTWEFEDGPCLYAGNRQAGPIYEIQEPNDSVIEGRYKEYMVNSAFSEVEYTYGLFNEDRCA